MYKNRVVITGLGVVSPAGDTIEDFWSALIKGRSYVRQIKRFDATGFHSQIAAEIDNFDPKDIIDPKIKSKADLFSQYGLLAAINAVNDSNLATKELNKGKCGVIIGSAAGGLSLAEKELLRKKDYNKIKPHTLFSVFPFSGACLISKYFNLIQPALAITTACSSASDAIGLAFERIKSGHSQIMLTGGSDSNIEPMIFYSLSVLRVMSKRNNQPEKACRPFDLKRDGFALGEGAAMLILENYEHAIARGAKIYAELLSYGASLDGYHITAREPSGEQAIRAAKIALENAHLTNKDINYISAHGTATKINDAVETLLIKQLCNDHAYKLMISSIKPIIGHAMGAASAFQAVANSLMFNHHKIPPTINYQNPDPECDLNYVPNDAIDKTVDYIMQNSAGFAGINSILIFGRAA